MPELKPTIRKSELIAKKYGYIANLYGRWRRLPIQGCYKAFNAFIQSSAADLAKHLTIEIDTYIMNEAKEEVKLFGLIHDSWTFYMRKETYRQHCIEIKRIIENVVPPSLIRVPILCNVDVSDTTWANIKPLEDFSCQN
jgi:DNA polymerase I-like protein with 3'-5' exonuclease and polymerase domains